MSSSTRVIFIADAEQYATECFRKAAMAMWHTPFSTKESALNTGKLVCKKLFDGEPPTLSKEEVKACLIE